MPGAPGASQQHLPSCIRLATIPCGSIGSPHSVASFLGPPRTPREHTCPWTQERPAQRARAYAHARRREGRQTASLTGVRRSDRLPSRSHQGAFRAAAANTAIPVEAAKRLENAPALRAGPLTLRGKPVVGGGASQVSTTACRPGNQSAPTLRSEGDFTIMVTHVITYPDGRGTPPATRHQLRLPSH